MRKSVKEFSIMGNNYAVLFIIHKEFGQMSYAGFIKIISRFIKQKQIGDFG